MRTVCSPYLRTRRLLLRRWKQSDFPPFAKINADPRVMEFMLRTMTPEETRHKIDEIAANFNANGFGLWAVEIAASEKFIGFVGLAVPGYRLPFTPCVEIAWRLCAEEWGKGYAPEAAHEAIRDGFERVGLQEIVSFTAATNDGKAWNAVLSSRGFRPPNGTRGKRASAPRLI